MARAHDIDIRAWRRDDAEAPELRRRDEHERR